MARRRRGHSVAASSVTTSITSTPLSSRYPSRAPSPPPAVPVVPFRFWDLPSELRLRVYQLVLIVPRPLDLDPSNHRLIAPLLALFLVSRRMHREAYPVFYSQPTRLFPTHGRFFHTPRPLIARLPPRYRHVISTAELRLGPGWTQPPRGQHTRAELGLADCVALRRLRVLVEIDPGDGLFEGFRGPGAAEDTYQRFCVGLVAGVLAQVPALRTVELDAYPGVKREAPLVMAVQRTVEEFGRRVEWGPLRGWGTPGEETGVEQAMCALQVADTNMTTMTVVEAH